MGCEKGGSWVWQGYVLAEGRAARKEGEGWLPRGVRIDRGMCGKGGNRRGRVGLCVQGDRGLWDRGDGRAGVCERLHR